MPQLNAFKAKLPLLFFREGKAVIAYCPSLNLSTCGKTLPQAQRRFSEALDLFIGDCVERGTLEEVLEECGWRRLTRPQPHWEPPSFLAQRLQEATIPIPT